jgi:L-lactate dehydrogenase complex protein LldG
VTSAREEILGRIRSALADVPAGERPTDVAVARAYRRHGELPEAARVQLLEERLLDYHASVRRVRTGEITGAVSEACAQWALQRIVVPPELPGVWRPGDVEVVEDHGLSARSLDDINGALTGCSGAIAQTGTLVLDGRGSSGRRVITLVPDHHICVVSSDQVVESVPEGMARVASAVIDERAPVTLVSGPSASSDIELSRVEGVHGPRKLLVLIIDDSARV